MGGTGRTAERAKSRVEDEEIVAQNDADCKPTTNKETVNNLTTLIQVKC